MSTYMNCGCIFICMHKYIKMCLYIYTYKYLLYTYSLWKCLLFQNVQNGAFHQGCCNKIQFFKVHEDIFQRFFYYSCSSHQP